MTRLGLGGRAAAGRQVVSWIHGEDFIRVIYWLIENPTITGPVNVTSPQPLPNSLFMRKLRAAWGIPFGLPAPGWLLPWAAALLGTETELILKSRNVAPGRLLQEGFVFRFPDWAEAARDLPSSGSSISPAASISTADRPQPPAKPRLREKPPG